MGTEGPAKNLFPNGATQMNLAFAGATTLANAAWAQWNPVYVNGKVAFRSAQTGLYLGRCHGCVTGYTYPDIARVSYSSPSTLDAFFTIACAPAR